jgi:hypothetical protein
VRSVLAQTDRDIHLLVVGDGEEPPLGHVTDSRLDVHRLRANRGTYFVHQVMLHASPHEWYAPVDADDWIEPEHLERMAALGSDAVATGTVWFHSTAGIKVWGLVDKRRPWYHVGRFATARMRGVGGYDPGERVGQDTLILRMLRVSGGLTRWAPPDPTYHRFRHSGTLTTSPATGLRSPERNAARRRNARVYAAADRLRTADAIRQYRTRHFDRRLVAEVAEEVERLRSRLGMAVAA